MKICIAQTNSVTGDIQTNIENHKKWIEKAVAEEAKIIIFPELSLTGYEPTLAENLATTADDPRLEDFQTISNKSDITIGVGVPTRADAGIHITMVLFQPGRGRITYSKKYLHPDEDAFFVSGKNFPALMINGINISLAICYEISVPQHAGDASKHGAQVYIASVAKFTGGIDKASETLAGIAAKYNMTVLMANCIGAADGGVCAGKSSIWDDKGNLLGQLDSTREGILIWNYHSKEVQWFADDIR